MKKEKVNYLIRYYFHLLPLEETHTWKYPYLSEIEKEIEAVRLTKIIVDDYEESVFWNLCPECNQLARTPKAKQCQHCYFDWH